ncbi:vesicle-associated membrane protein 7-like [Babylonia areolata]|uniref:vesicle-associated membrane protein 7-like n=1 Tax=Babylonia areolata TaxID=304850 RepID=UPI003FD2C558
MTIVYSCIARGTNVLCSNQTGAGSYSSTIQSMLGNIPSTSDGKRTYSANNNDYHCLIENGIVFVCVTESGISKQQPYSFLAEIKRRLQSGPLAMRAMTAGTGELDKDFNFVLAQQMKNFSKAGNDNVSRLQSQVDEVKGVMTQNIEMVLERGERLEDLMDKTDDLSASAMTFQKTARRIRKKYWWQNKKMTLIICGISLLVIIVIIIIVLFSTGVLPPSSSDDSGSKGGVTTTSP